MTIAMVLSGSAAPAQVAVKAEQPVELFPLRRVRLLESPFSEAVEANRHYLLAHDPDRLLAPFRREAGLDLKARPYGNWESIGLDGHTAGHYLSALSLMMASGADPDGEFRRRLDWDFSAMIGHREGPEQYLQHAPAYRGAVHGGTGSRIRQSLHPLGTLDA